MKPNLLLKFAIALCLLFALTRLAEFIYIRIPPYAEGECRNVKRMNGLLMVKIKENHIVHGYSDIEIYMELLKERETTQASFMELREDLGEKVPCP